MAGEHSYSSEAVQALCDTYYQTPGARVETIRTQAAAGQLENVSPHVQEEIGQISRAQCFELLRKDPRHHSNPRNRLDRLDEQLIAMCEEDIALLETLPRGKPKSAAIRDLTRSLSTLHNRARKQPKPRDHTHDHATSQGLLDTLTAPQNLSTRNYTT